MVGVGTSRALGSLVSLLVRFIEESAFTFQTDAETVCEAAEDSSVGQTLSNLFLSFCCIYFIESGEDCPLVLGQVCVPWSRPSTL